MAIPSPTIKGSLFFYFSLFILLATSLSAQESYDFSVYNGEGKPIGGAEVDLRSCGLSVQRTLSDGTLHFTLPTNTGCYVTIRKFGMQEVVTSVAASLVHQIPIAMTPDRSAGFIGSVLAGSGPLSGATAYARSRTTNHWTKATANAGGQYQLRLLPRQEYVLTYAQSGYADEQRVIQTERDNPQNVQLQTVVLQPGNSVTMAWLAQNPGGVPKFVDIPALQPGGANGYTVQIASGPTDFTEVSMKFGELTPYGRLYTKQEGDRYKLRLGIYTSRQEAQAVVNKIKPDFTGAFATTEPNISENMIVQSGQSFAANGSAAAPAQYSTPISPRVIQPQRTWEAKGVAPQQYATPANNENTRYAIQVGAFTTDGPIAMNKFSKLDGLGDIYSKVENGILKIRVGLWTSAEQAKAAKRSAVARGFKDATVVTENIQDPALKNYLAQSAAARQEAMPVENDPRPVVYSYKSPVAPKTKTVITSQPYYIRIAALSNPERFNPQPFQGLGSIEMRHLDNGMTLVLLGRFSSLKQADATRKKLRAQGYNDPYVVKDEGAGNFKRM
ncbi:MAG: SPOR domain-containing protein [Saprospiraceae bacterium]